jgi:hypothetical protein
MEVPRTDGDVVSSGVMLTLIICNVLFSRKVLDAIFPLFDWICNPKESHFHGVRALTLDRVVGYADGRRIVAIDWYWRLRMAEFFQHDAKNCSPFAV